MKNIQTLGGIFLVILVMYIIFSASVDPPFEREDLDITSTLEISYNLDQEWFAYKENGWREVAKLPWAQTQIINAKKWNCYINEKEDQIACFEGLKAEAKKQ